MSPIDLWQLHGAILPRVFAVEGWSVPFELVVLGGVVFDELAGRVAFLVGLSGLFCTAGRYAAAHFNCNDRQIQRAAGLGFFLGLCLGVGFLVADLLA